MLFLALIKFPMNGGISKSIREIQKQKSIKQIVGGLVLLIILINLTQPFFLLRLKKQKLWIHNKELYWN